MRIVYAGTPEITTGVLRALIASNHEVIACYTQPDRKKGRGQAVTQSPIKEIAIANNIQVFQPNSLKPTENQLELKELNPDLVLVFAYGLILPQAVLDIPKYGCINVHASILPRWRGAAPIQHAILAGDKETGITMMQMDAGLDTGDMLNIFKCPIECTDNTATLSIKLSELAVTATLDTLDRLETNTIHPIPQQDANATYAAKISKQDGKINWEESAENICRKIRAYNPWPVAFCQLNSTNIRIWEAQPVELKDPAKPGTILTADKDQLLIACGIGAISIKTLQIPGKKAINIKQYLTGKSIFIVDEVLI